METVKPSERFIRLADICAALGGAHPRTIIRLIEDGQLFGIRIRNRGASKWLISETSFAEFLRRRATDAAGVDDNF